LDRDLDMAFVWKFNYAKPSFFEFPVANKGKSSTEQWMVRPNNPDSFKM
jgi:hypothetical protein